MTDSFRQQTLTDKWILIKKSANLQYFDLIFRQHFKDFVTNTLCEKQIKIVPKFLEADRFCDQISVKRSSEAPKFKPSSSYTGLIDNLCLFFLILL